MASLRGERFDLNLDEQGQQQPDDKDADPATSAGFSFVSDIKERPVNDAQPPTAPSLKNNASGFPAHRDRLQTSRFKAQRSQATPAGPSILKNDEALSPASQPLSATAGPMEGHPAFFEASERERIDAENKQKLEDMAPEEIERERQELFAGLDPTIIEKLLKRSTIDNEPSPTFGTEMTRPPVRDSQSPHRKRPSVGAVRKVSFAVEPDEQEDNELTKRPTAERHSISSQSFSSLSTTSSQETEVPDEPQKSPTKHKRRPSPHSRKVSFAVSGSHSTQLEGDEPSAAKHSISPSPRARSISTSNTDIDDIPLPPPAQPLNPLDVIPPPVSPMDTLQPLASNLPDASATTQSVHWPQPAQPDLDPNSETFLDDLHEKYFPNLSHDPSKLDWMKPSSTAEDSSYDPSAASISPSDLRFDFNGALIPPSKAATIPTNLGLHNHGDAPSAAGYTIPELARLARSTFPAQRCIAIQTLGRILYRLGKGEFGDENDIDERAPLARGLWDVVSEGRVVETLQEEAGKTRGHQTSIALAREAVWNWRRGGGRQRKAV